MTNVRIVSDQSLPAKDRKIAELTALVSEMARRLEDLNAEVRSAIDHQAAEQTPAGLDLSRDVRTARKLRHLRKRVFGEDLDSGPAWDILLHLFESHVTQRRDTVGTATDGAQLPCATAFRWIARLESEGLIVQRDDHLDRRRRFVELTQAGVELMMAYFTGAAPSQIAA